MKVLNIALVLRVLFMMRESAIEPLERVASSFVRMNSTVVENKLMSFTSHGPDPVILVSQLGEDM